MIIKETYTNEKGQTLNIRDIHFENQEDMRGNLGKFITDSHQEEIDSIDYTYDGIYLYQSSYDPKKALRLYRDFHAYKYISHNDCDLVYRLQKKQSEVILTEFPTGVITIENKVVGQEVPYYENHEAVKHIFEQGIYKKNPTYYYIEILKIIRELYECGIMYQDIHAKNFMFNLYNETIKIIDFEPYRVSFDDSKKYVPSSMISNLKSMINTLNEISGIKFTSNFNQTNTLDEIEECVFENHMKLK